MRHVIWIAAAGLAVVASANAVNMTFLKDTPMTRFNAEDYKILKSAVEKTLNEGADGASVDWRNEKTSAEGTITPIKSYEASGAKCRDVRIANRYAGLNNEGTYTFCRTADKPWAYKR
jgi:surface antigen